MTAAELAGRFEVSVRTIYRDIDALSAAGVPVYTTQGKGGGVALMDHYILDRAAFTEEEQRQLLTALQSLPEAARAGADETLAKLSGLFRRRETDWLQVDLSRWGSVEADQRKFEALKTAILDRRAAAFTYVSSYGLTTDRRVLPARLVFKGQSWYLQAYCTEKEDYRTFKVSRILKLSVLAAPSLPRPSRTAASPAPSASRSGSVSPPPWPTGSTTSSTRAASPASPRGNCSSPSPSRTTTGSTGTCSPSAPWPRCWIRRLSGGGWQKWRRIFGERMQNLTWDVRVLGV